MMYIFYEIEKYKKFFLLIKLRMWSKWEVEIEFSIRVE